MSNSNSLEVYEPAINNSEDVVKRTSETINVIKNETILLKDKQKKIDQVIEQLETDVINTDNKNPKEFKNFRDKPMSASEKMEKIKAFVELSRISVDISKTAIKSAQDIQKIRIDATIKAKALFPDDYDTASLTMDDVIKMKNNPDAYLDDIKKLKDKKKDQTQNEE